MLQVEYLYTLVYETLDRLARKGKERDLLKSSLLRDGDDVEADLDVSIIADEPDFLDLNDIKACVKRWPGAVGWHEGAITPRDLCSRRRTLIWSRHTIRPPRYECIPAPVDAAGKRPFDAVVSSCPHPSMTD
jgi:hypothetical protein